ncbi:hypothetical protein GHT06_020320 [Daphnia sinensis]|uniref:Reverse transcriptase domain-containing protein n=1 Tax=Daphnia sinensis TaxID=1820382 RepID=A0AAD5L2X0_9CRUS|nr:hypothetical protein GHT06_020320 [Daphnia sinensis]
MSQGDAGAISLIGSDTQPKQTCGYCCKIYKGKKDSKFCSKLCFHGHQKMASNKTAQIINSLSQGAIAVGGDPDTFATPTERNHAKRPLSADSSLEEDQIEPKKNPLRRPLPHHAPADRISLAEMEQLLESSAGGPVPSSVRQKDNNIYVRLNDPADVERVKSILESKEGPNHKSIFNSVSRPSKFYPGVALFVDLSYLPNLKDEIMSVSQLYAKPDSSRGHVKILFNCKATRDSGYGPVKASCRAKKPNCGKCVGTHLTRDCNSQERKCPWQDTEPELKEIDEPFAKNPKTPTIMNIPPGYIAFHALNHEHAYGAAILVKLALAESCRAGDLSCRNHVAAVDLSTAHGAFRFISVYLRPSCPDFSALFCSDLSELLSASSIVAVDSNAMNKLWNSKITNKRGLEIESLIHNHNLSLLNRPAAKLDFVPAGTSFLDITLAGDKILAPQWFFPTIPSMSDHPYIDFEIACILPHSSDRPFTTKSSPRVPHISRIDMERFRETLVSSVQSLNIPPFPYAMVEQRAVCFPFSIPPPPVTERELEAAVELLNPKAAPGEDGITPAIIKECFPLIKKRIILSRLQWLAHNNKWICSNQHGFMDGKSTKSAGHALVSYIEEAIDQKRHTASWHPAILSSLIERKCPPYLTRMVSSFLSNRNALLSHNGSNLAHVVNLGCPQGGVLSSFLWVVLIDDVLRLSLPFPHLILGYADDLIRSLLHTKTLY